MKLGLGLYRQMLSVDNFRFAKQANATHIVAHLTDYYNSNKSLSTSSGNDAYGITTNQGKMWSFEELSDLRKAINAEGLELAALENCDPSHRSEPLSDFCKDSVRKYTSRLDGFFCMGARRRGAA